jgi:hypothetical protein
MYQSALPIVISAYRKIADVSFAQEKVTIHPGSEATLALKATRLNDYAGPLQVQVQGVPGGVTIANATIPEKAAEAKLVIRAAKNAAENKSATVTVRLSGVVGPVTLVTESKFTIVVQKRPAPPLF